MYTPAANAEHRPVVMFDFIEAHPLGALVTVSGSELIATHLPLLLDRSRGAQERDAKVVPTWNCVAIHAYGPVRFRPDREFLRGHVGGLTARHEGSREQPWAVADAPEEYVERMLGAIVGVEIEISRLEGKWKMSQNRAAEDIDGVVAGLGEADDARVREVAAIVQARRPHVG